MAKARYAIVLAVALIATAGFLGTSAFTSASLDRDATVSVVSDDSGPLALSAGNTEFVSVSSDTGKLSIGDPTGNATGVNPDATYVIGDSENADTEYAFSITNQNNKAHSVSLSTSDDMNGVSFTLYDSSGTAASGSSVDLNSGDTAYVLMTLNSGDKGVDLGGTLTVQANATA